MCPTFHRTPSWAFDSSLSNVKDYELGCCTILQTPKQTFWPTQYFSPFRLLSCPTENKRTLESDATSVPMLFPGWPAVPSLPLGSGIQASSFRTPSSPFSPPILCPLTNMKCESLAPACQRCVSLSICEMGMTTPAALLTSQGSGEERVR